MFAIELPTVTYINVGDIFEAKLRQKWSLQQEHITELMETMLSVSTLKMYMNDEQRLFRPLITVD